MALLDLAPSRAKITRAREHLETLKSEVGLVMNERDPHSFRFTEIDDDTGLCRLFFTPHEVARELRLGVLVGDVIHNLRSALDLIVSELVDASGIRPTQRHQFPIYVSRQRYEEAVGHRSTAKPNGPLGGIVYGVSAIWDVQPFHAEGDPRLSILALIHDFSNGDKHRLVARFAPLIDKVRIRLAACDELVSATPIPVVKQGWEADKEYEILRLEFRRPFPTDMHAYAEVAVAVHFMTKPLDIASGEVLGIDVPADLDAMCKYVLGIAELFELF